MTETVTRDTSEVPFDERSFEEFRRWSGVFWRGEADIVMLYFSKYRSPEGDRRFLARQEAEGMDWGRILAGQLANDYLAAGSVESRQASVFHLMFNIQEASHGRWLTAAHRLLVGEDRPLKQELTHQVDDPSRSERGKKEFYETLASYHDGDDPAARAGVLWGMGGGSAAFYGIHQALRALPSRMPGEELLLWICKSIVTDEYQHSVAEGHEEIEEACKTTDDWDRAKTALRDLQMYRFRNRLRQFSIPKSEWDRIIATYDEAAMAGPPYNDIEPLLEEEILGISPLLTGEMVTVDKEGILIAPELVHLSEPASSAQW